jgi:hypothetical protein
MSAGPVTLTATRIVEGRWHGLLAGIAAPRLVVEHQGRPLPFTIAPAPGGHAVTVPIPAALLSDGVQTFLIRQEGETEVLASFAIIAGATVDTDLRAELDLLRAELDMLKRAFRRHCLETAGPSTAARSAGGFTPPAPPVG